MTTARPDTQPNPQPPLVLVHRHPRTLEILGLWLLEDEDKEPTPYYDAPDPFHQQNAQRDLDQKGPDPTWLEWLDQLTWRTPIDAWYSLKPVTLHETLPEAMARLRAQDRVNEAKARKRVRVATTRPRR